MTLNILVATSLVEIFSEGQTLYILGQWMWYVGNGGIQIFTLDTTNIMLDISPDSFDGGYLRNWVNSG